MAKKTGFSNAIALEVKKISESWAADRILQVSCEFVLVSVSLLQIRPVS